MRRTSAHSLIFCGLRALGMSASGSGVIIHCPTEKAINGVIASWDSINNPHTAPKHGVTLGKLYPKRSVL